MSAITGIFYRDGRKVDPALIKKMNDQLNHRGPDGSAVWCEDNVAFGHQMLWTTPESLHEKLPFKESDLVITADARIDNRKELSEKLGIEDKEDVSDSYFILKAYEKWSEKCPEHLLGDFAFAVWDKNNGKLFCARDHIGVKPFYYYLDDKMFVFGTEIKAIFCCSQVPRKLNELKVAHHLIPMYSDRKLTFYEKIYRLPAANTLTIKLDDNQKRKYWNLDPKLEIERDSNDEYYREFREILEEAIKCRIRSSHEVGFELSGGIDSSSIVVMAKKILIEEETDIETFSLIFNEIKETDESFYIKKIVETGGIKPHYLAGDSISPFKDMEKIFFHHEEPFDTPNMAMNWEFYKMLNLNGFRIILGGQDGDCLYYKGENYLLELFINLNWIKLIREIKILSDRYKYNPFKYFILAVIFPLFPQIMDLWMRFKGIRYEEDFNKLNNEFIQSMNLKKYYKENELDPFRKANDSKKMHYYFLTLATHQTIFEMIDKIAGAFSIEPRHPLMDKRLIEFSYSLPTEIKYNNGWDRLLVRIGLAEFLPKEIQWRLRKTNFFPVFERNLLLFENKRLKSLLYKNDSINNYINCKELPKIYHNYLNGKGSPDSLDIWKIAILSMWFENNCYL